MKRRTFFLNCAGAAGLIGSPAAHASQSAASSANDRTRAKKSALKLTLSTDYGAPAHWERVIEFGHNQHVSRLVYWGLDSADVFAYPKYTGLLPESSRAAVAESRGRFSDAAEKTVRTGIWQEADRWPSTQAQYQRFYLHSEGKAESLSGDGTLSTTVPGAETADQYTYDPADPVPTRGSASGALDQRSVERRRDVLIYSSPEFKAGTDDIEITGPITTEIYASTSAVDTDFTAKLVDVGQMVTPRISRTESSGPVIEILLKGLNC